MDATSPDSIPPFPQGRCSAHRAAGPDEHRDCEACAWRWRVHFARVVGDTPAIKTLRRIGLLVALAGAVLGGWSLAHHQPASWTPLLLSILGGALVLKSFRLAGREMTRRLEAARTPQGSLAQG